MKRKMLTAAVCCSLLAACLVWGACSPGQNQNSQTSKVSAQSSAPKESSTALESVSEEPADDSSSEIEESTSAPESEPSSTSDSSKEEQSSEESTEESSTEESSTVESSMEESSLPEAYDGYYFDDEQIVEDYHTAHDFTDNEEFNALFAENDLNRQFESDSREVENESDMRALTIRYGELWKQEAQDAYEKLSVLLEEVPAEQEKLVQSQQTWEASLEETENGFLQEASEQGVQGTQAMLAADSAMMNYYKGRAAVLYEQIYQLTGSFSLD